MSIINDSGLTKFENSLDKLRLYIEHENYKGYDPYD